MRFGVFVALGLALGLACSLADELEGAACRVEADCEKSQICAKTLHQLQTGVGQCSSNGSCVVGEQIGCRCDGQACTNFELIAVQHPEMEDATDAPLCFCCQGADQCGSDQEPLIEAVDGSETSARCRCCPRCDDVSLQEREFDNDGNIVDCDCREPMTSTGESATGTTAG
jgi:hypothetical protein